MNLVNQSGENIDLPGSAWDEILHVAVLHGWTPQGTSSPPVDFDGRPRTRWNGCYDTATGQMVVRSDAARLADAVEAATASISLRHLTSRQTGGLLRFLRSGPFLLTGENSDPLPAFDHQLLSLGSALSVDAGVGVEVETQPETRSAQRVFSR